MISLSKGFEHWTTHLDVSIEKPMQIVGQKRIGQLLCPREVFNTNKSVISRCVAEILSSEL